MVRQRCPFQEASNGSNGALWLAMVKPAAHPSDGPAMASAVRFALAPAATAGPGTVRHPPLATVAALADGAVNAAAPTASAVATAPILTGGRRSHER